MAITLAIRDEITHLTKAGYKPTQIITTLRLNENADQSLIKNRDIYNIKVATRVKALGSLTST